MSSNIFQQVLTDANGVEAELMGPNYPYYQNIQAPQNLGMSSEGSLSALGNDVNGLIDYVGLLVSGTSNASVTGQPLGDKFFLKTGATCLDNSSNQQDRYIYINNVPSGNIPFISSGMGQDYSDLRGLIPGMMSDMTVLNPYNIMRGFLSGSTPSCQKLKMQVIDASNNSSNETHYVTVVDIQNMDPCSFQNGVNPITNVKCKESFISYDPCFKLFEDMNEDSVVQIYFISLLFLMSFILYRFMLKDT